MSVRRAQPGDREEWLRMRHELWPHAADEHARDVDAYFRDAAARSAAFVVEASGRHGLVGFLARLREYAEGCSSSPVAYIEGWYVAPGLRREGVGAALVRAAEGWARELGMTEIASDAEPDNEVSRRAHEALGYTEVGRVVCFRKGLDDGV